MSPIIIFFENREIKAIYNDEKKLKKDVLTHIVDFHVKNNIYPDRAMTVKNLKNKFKNFFKKDNYFLEHMNNTWSLSEIEMNQIMDEIKSSSYTSQYTKINVKAKECVKRDLSKDLQYLPLSPVYSD